MGMLRGLAALGAGLMLAACATLGADETPTAEPSPRPECAEVRAVIYFTPDSATLQPLSEPLLRDMMERARACEGAGGALRAIRVTSYPDRTAGSGQARAEMEARNQRVREALIEHGAPADRISTHLGRRERGAIMQRRSEVIADLY